jgi:hypothetical protein
MAAPIFPSDTRHLCRGTWKASGIESERMELIGCKTPHAFYELVCRLFCKANRKFGVQYYAGSCAFTIEEYYFSIDQMSRMTDYGKRLTQPKGERAPKYAELMNAMKGANPCKTKPNY